LERETENREEKKRDIDIDFFTPFLLLCIYFVRLQISTQRKRQVSGQGSTQRVFTERRGSGGQREGIIEERHGRSMSGGGEEHEKQQQKARQTSPISPLPGASRLN